MQEFTRSLSREIVVGGERLALVLGAEGISIRPVGSRKPPVTASWAAFVCSAVGVTLATAEPSEADLTAALERLRNRKATPAATSASGSPEASAGSSPDSTIGDVLGRIEHWFHQYRPRFVKALQAGATPVQMDSAQQSLGHPIPAELRQIFAWHNGQNQEVVGTFERSFHLASVEELVTLTRDLAHRPPPGWQPSWLPFLVSDSDSYIVVASDQPGCPVHEVWHGKTSHPQVAPTLLAWLTHFADTLSAQGYVEDPERGDLLRKS